MLDAGAGYKVTKNRLTRIALKGTKLEPLSELFTGPTAIAYSEDPVAAAKSLGQAIGEELDMLSRNSADELKRMREERFLKMAG